ncbi:hypothetical protein N7457_008742 [Penicillium paradoxum]|uniref:uncharacterized protein n=1 Tax=Penicillium paradoxum TaxID=176176 RepID=UPI002546978A|nr:uncharacterized protein N7457_008742 [Penicillium paradoxum]KAJ5773846.1 hypothetical protein N7457_008742 [Penicillium paradoxum]
MSDDEIAKVDAVDVQHPWNWRMGTGYHSPGNTAPREAAAERTYLLVDVWGYSPSADEDTRQTPNATLTCLRPEPVKPDSSDEAIEPSTRTTASTSTTSSAGTPTENSGILGKHAEPVIGLVLLVSLVFMGV